MATTVRQLISSLQSIKDQDQAILFQYILAEHTDISVPNFEKLVGRVEQSSSFGDETSKDFIDWLYEVDDEDWEED